MTEAKKCQVLIEASLKSIESFAADAKLTRSSGGFFIPCYDLIKESLKDVDQFLNDLNSLKPNN